MADISGYQIYEFFLAMAMTYAVWIAFVTLQAIRHEQGKSNAFKGVFQKTGALEGTGLLIIGGIALICGIYLLPVRIGTLMFINGAICAMMVWFTFGE